MTPRRSDGEVVRVCGGCGHSIELHGRRGYGACRHQRLTEAGRSECERLKGCSDDQYVVAAVVRVALALPGMFDVCDCRRFKKGRALSERTRS